MIIFANKNNKEQRWHLLIAASAIVAMLVIALIAFYPRTMQSTSKAPAALLDFSIVDSDFVKNLEPFPTVNLQGVQAGRSEPFMIYYQQQKK